MNTGSDWSEKYIAYLNSEAMPKISDNELLEIGKADLGLRGKIGFYVRNIFSRTRPDFNKYCKEQGRLVIQKRNISYLEERKGQDTRISHLGEVLRKHPPANHILSTLDIERGEYYYCREKLGRSYATQNSWLPYYRTQVGVDLHLLDEKRDAVLGKIRRLSELDDHYNRWSRQELSNVEFKTIIDLVLDGKPLLQINPSDVKMVGSFAEAHVLRKRDIAELKAKMKQAGLKEEELQIIIDQTRRGRDFVALSPQDIVTMQKFAEKVSTLPLADRERYLTILQGYPLSKTPLVTDSQMANLDQLVQNFERYKHLRNSEKLLPAYVEFMRQMDSTLGYTNLALLQPREMERFDQLFHLYADNEDVVTVRNFVHDAHLLAGAMGRTHTLAMNSEDIEKLEKLVAIQRIARLEKMDQEKVKTLCKMILTAASKSSITELTPKELNHFATLAELSTRYPTITPSEVMQLTRRFPNLGLDKILRLAPIIVDYKAKIGKPGKEFNLTQFEVDMEDFFHPKKPLNEVSIEDIERAYRIFTADVIRGSNLTLTQLKYLAHYQERCEKIDPSVMQMDIAKEYRVPVFQTLEVFRIAEAPDEGIQFFRAVSDHPVLADLLYTEKRGERLANRLPPAEMMRIQHRIQEMYENVHPAHHEEMRGQIIHLFHAIDCSETKDLEVKILDPVFRVFKNLPAGVSPQKKTLPALVTIEETYFAPPKEASPAIKEVMNRFHHLRLLTQHEIDDAYVSFALDQSIKDKENPASFAGYLTKISLSHHIGLYYQPAGQKVVEEYLKKHEPDLACGKTSWQESLFFRQSFEKQVEQIEGEIYTHYNEGFSKPVFSHDLIHRLITSGNEMLDGEKLEQVLKRLQTYSGMIRVEEQSRWRAKEERDDLVLALFNELEEPYLSAIVGTKPEDPSQNLYLLEMLVQLTQHGLDTYDVHSTTDMVRGIKSYLDEYQKAYQVSPLVSLSYLWRNAGETQVQQEILENIYDNFLTEIGDRFQDKRPPNSSPIHPGTYAFMAKEIGSIFEDHEQIANPEVREYLTQVMERALALLDEGYLLPALQKNMEKNPNLIKKLKTIASMNRVPTGYLDLGFQQILLEKTGPQKGTELEKMVASLQADPARLLTEILPKTLGEGGSAEEKAKIEAATKEIKTLAPLLRDIGLLQFPVDSVSNFLEGSRPELVTIYDMVIGMVKEAPEATKEKVMDSLKQATLKDPDLIARGEKPTASPLYSLVESWVNSSASAQLKRDAYKKIYENQLDSPLLKDFPKEEREEQAHEAAKSLLQIDATQDFLLFTLPKLSGGAFKQQAISKVLEILPYLYSTEMGRSVFTPPVQYLVDNYMSGQTGKKKKTDMERQKYNEMVAPILKLYGLKGADVAKRHHFESYLKFLNELNDAIQAEKPLDKKVWSIKMYAMLRLYIQELEENNSPKKPLPPGPNKGA